MLGESVSGVRRFGPPHSRFARSHSAWPSMVTADHWPSLATVCALMQYIVMCIGSEFDEKAHLILQL